MSTTPIKNKGEGRENKENGKETRRKSIIFSSSITPKHRQLVHIEAARVKLSHKSTGTGKNRYITVSEMTQKGKSKSKINVSLVYLYSYTYIYSCKHVAPFSRNAHINLQHLHMYRRVSSRQERWMM